MYKKKKQSLWEKVLYIITKLLPIVISVIALIISAFALFISWKSYQLAELQNIPQFRIRYVDIRQGSLVQSALREVTGADVSILETSVFKMTEDIQTKGTIRFLILESVGELYVPEVYLFGRKKIFTENSYTLSDYSLGEQIEFNLPGGLKKGDIVAVPIASEEDGFKFEASSESIRIQEGKVGIYLSITQIKCKLTSGRKVNIPVRERLEPILSIRNILIGP